jgi:hypothetical protein
MVWRVGVPVRHLVSLASPDQTLVPLAELPSADRIEIVAEDDGYYLFRYAKDGQPLGDSWFATLAEALSQGEFEYAVGTEDWS